MPLITIKIQIKFNKCKNNIKIKTAKALVTDSESFSTTLVIKQTILYIQNEEIQMKVVIKKNNNKIMTRKEIG